MSLRTRLIVAFLGLALVPTALLSTFTLVELDRSAKHWFQPGVEHALSAALEVSKSSLARMDAIVLAQADDWGETWPAGRLPDADRMAVSLRLRATGLDVLQTYRRAGTGWTLDEQIMAAGTLVPERVDLSDQIESSLGATRVLHSSRGVLGAVSRTADGSAVMAGMWVPPDLFEQVDRVSVGTAFYRRLGVVVDVQRHYVWLLVAAVMLALAIAAVLIATALARGMARPLSELSGAIERVAAGDLSTRVAPHGAPEMRTLTHAFNAMTGRLESAREQLRQAEREAAWRDVARHLAHEIKNPLTPMRLSLHRLQRRVDLVPAEQRDAVRDSIAALLQEVEHLARLAEQFSQYARLPEPRFERVDLAEVARAAANLHEPEGIALTLPPDRAIPVWGDRLLLSRAVHNLLLNAREASPPGGRVDVRVEAVDGHAVLEISDRGEGVSPSVHERLFEPYVSTKSRGSGLGLSLVRDIATRHGGAVTLDNRAEGGARACLSLPLLTEERRMDAGT